MAVRWFLSAGVLICLTSIVESHAGFVSVTVEGPGGTGSATIAAENDRIAHVTKDFTSLDPITITFQVDSADSYYFDEGVISITTPVEPSGSITNNTGITWTDFHWELVGAPAGAKFSIVHAPEGWEPSLSDTEASIFGGRLPPGGVLKTFIGVVITEAGTYSIRQTPTVPEPASWLSLGIAAIAGGAGCSGRHRRASGESQFHPESALGDRG